MAANTDAVLDSLQNELAVQQARQDNSGLIDTYQKIGEAYLGEDAFQESLENYHFALSIAEEFQMHKELANIHVAISDVYEKLKNTETAIEELREALRIGDNFFSTLEEVNVFSKLSNLLLKTGSLDEAYDYQLRLLRYWEDQEDESKVAKTYYQIASVYFAQQNFKEALNYYEKTLEIEEKLGNQEKCANSLAAIASVYGRMQEYDKSLQKNFEAFNLSEEYCYKNGMAYAAHNISADYLSMGKIKEAAPYIQKSLQLRRELDDKLGENHSLQAQGYMHMLLGDYNKAFASMEKALGVAKEMNNKPLIRDTYRILSQAYSEAKDWEKSFDQYRVYTAYKDSMLNDATNQKMNQLELRYEVEKKEKEKQIELLTKDKQIAALYRYGIIGGLVLLLSLVSLLLLFVFYRYKNQAAVNSILTDKNLKIQLQNAQLARSNRDLEQFAYIASHDLKEPLRNIGGFITLLNRRCGHYQDAEALDYMEFITKSVDHMHNLLTDLLAYSRIGIVSREHEEVEMSKVVKTVKNSFKSFIEEQEAVITIDSLPVLHANRTQMIQLIQNLIGNALKFRSEKSPHIHIECMELPDRFVFSVQDNGIGMQQEYTDKIFVIFQRLHNRTQYEGTGIGLSICKKIVEQHQGEIWVESQSGKGSKFYFSISKDLEKKKDETLTKELIAA
ncbi:MAG: tetratricopeptide repeat protein [Chitinophagales bacterium]